MTRAIAIAVALGGCTVGLGVGVRGGGGVAAVPARAPSPPAGGAEPDDVRPASAAARDAEFVPGALIAPLIGLPLDEAERRARALGFEQISHGDRVPYPGCAQGIVCAINDFTTLPPDYALHRKRARLELEVNQAITIAAPPPP